MDADTSDESPSRWSRILGRIVLAIVALAVLVFPLLPGLGHSPESYHRANCVSNLKQFGIALLNYHDQNKTFPPPYIANADGKPMHSWRVLLLPYFEDPNVAILAKQYRFDEPWNGPNNRALTTKAPAVFRCPSATDGEGETSYVAVVGDQTVWPGTKGIALRGIGDAVPKTIAIVETAHSAINWLEPRDITMAQALSGINPGAQRPCISSDHSSGANILFADGAVHYLNNETPRETLRGLLTPNGGEKVEIPDW